MRVLIGILRLEARVKIKGLLKICSLTGITPAKKVSNKLGGSCGTTD